MRILEFEAKDLLRENGLPVPKGAIVYHAKNARGVVEDIGSSVIVKAQVPASGRSQAGGIMHADTPDSAVDAANVLLGTYIYSHEVRAVLIEERIDIESELYLAVTYESKARRATVVASRYGGTDVESSGNVIRHHISFLSRQDEMTGRELANRLAIDSEHASQLAELTTQIIKCFMDWDALLLEINPLIIDRKGSMWLADIHLELDEAARFRQEEILSRVPVSRDVGSAKSSFEQKAAQINDADHRGVAGRLVPFSGNLGLLIGGGGASLTTFDAVLEAGLKPANYCEIGGNPSVWKIKELTKLIVSQPHVDRLAVIMNVVSNTRADLVARGVIKGIRELGKDPAEVIVAFRVPGSWEEESRAILDHYSIKHFGRETSLDEVVEAVKFQF